MALLHSSTRRPSPLRPVDYDHEIDLVDHTSTNRSPTRSPSALREPSTAASDSSSRRHSDAPLQHKESHRQKLRQEIARRKYKKYQDRRLDQSSSDGPGVEEGDDSQEQECNDEERGRKRTKSPESTIDVLYENQRGGFLCGIPLFASKALGNLDPSPWTNIAQKTSATNIKNAQVPDPSWEWAWKDWSINHDEGADADEDGWEYSFAFSKHFSWHGPSWWNSFVRRRAWIRKRVKKTSNHPATEAHGLDSDYFTIHPNERSRSRSKSVDPTGRKRPVDMDVTEEELLAENIEDIGSLMLALRIARIDREKMEAVENFIEHGGDDLYYLRERMHDIMGAFIFQASRRLLLTHILKIYNVAVEREKSFGDERSKKRVENLEAALKHADEEVQRLEFWSDVKTMAEKGHTKGAVDEAQGWDSQWVGLDDSGPKDVISDRKLLDLDKSKHDKEDHRNETINGIDKGKAKA